MIIREKMSDAAALVYDLEEGEILEEEEEEEEEEGEIDIRKNFQDSPCSRFEDNLQNAILSGTDNYFIPGKESKYQEKIYFSSENYLPAKHKFHQYPRRIKDISKKVRKSKHSSEYEAKLLKKLAIFKSRKKSRSRSVSSSSSSSNCSCSSCTSCSVSSFDERVVQPSSQSTDGSRFSKPVNNPNKGKKKTNQPRRKEKILETTEKVQPKKQKQKTCSVRKENSGNSFKKADHVSAFVSKSRKSTSRLSLSKKLARNKVRTRSIRTLKSKLKSQSKSKKITVSHSTRENESITSTNTALDKGIVLPKLIPGSIGEMLLSKRLKRELKKDLPSPGKGISRVLEQEDNIMPVIHAAPKTFEIVDLCNDNDDESEEDELTLRIKALESTMKPRHLFSSTKGGQNEGSKNESITLDESQINFDVNDKVSLKGNEKEISDGQNSNATLVSEKEIGGKDLEKLENSNNNNKNLKTSQEDHSCEDTFTDNNKNENFEFYSVSATVEEKTEGESSDYNKMMKDKYDIASIDMDISNDSFGDSATAHSESNSCTHTETNGVALTQESRTSCPDSSFPVEWAYMMPPPCNADQSGGENLNSISNWCFNQNMFVQSMQETVNNLGPEESWKSAESNSYGTDYYNSTSNYSFQPPLATSETRRVVFEDYHCNYNIPLATTVDTSLQSGELRDCHAEQYKSFMSTVIQNNRPPVNHKKDQHRDLINIDLRPRVFQNSNLVSVNPDKKVNAAKRRSRKRRRSNRKSVSGPSPPMIQINTQEIPKPEASAIDDDDEDMLRAMLLNEMSLKNQRVNQDSNKHEMEINNNNDDGKSKNIKRKTNYNRTERLVRVGESLEVSFSNQNAKFRKIGPQARSKWPVDRRLASKKLPNSKLQDTIQPDQKFGSEVNLRGFSLPKFPPIRPVIININNDSDSEEETVKKAKAITKREKVILGIDSFIKSVRNSQTIAQEKSTKSTSVPTPKGVSHLSEEKQEEYRKLKALMVAKRRALQLKSKINPKLPLKIKSNSCKVKEKDDDLEEKDCKVECKANETAIDEKRESKTECKAREVTKDVKEEESESKLNSKIESGLDNLNEVKKLLKADDCKEENSLSIKVFEGDKEFTGRNCSVEVPMTNAQILPVDEEQKSESSGNAANILQRNAENVDNLVITSEANDFKDDDAFSESINDAEVGKEEKLLSSTDNLTSQTILSSNFQIPLTAVSKSDENVNESVDSSEESSSSDTESSSSSSSNDSDSDMEEQTEIDLRNRLLQKRQEQLQKKNECVADNNGQAALVKNDKFQMCEENIESPVVESQDFNSLCSVDILPNVDGCENTKEEIVKEINLDISVTPKETEEEKENEPTRCNEIIPPENNGEVAPTSTIPLKPILLNSLTDNCKNNSVVALSSSSRVDTKTHMHRNSCLKNQSVENKISSSPHSLKNEDTKETLQEKQSKTRDNVANTLNKLHQEFSNRILSVETLTSKISDLFLEAEKEDSYCQSMFNNIIKLLSQINELRKHRKEKKSHITGIFAKIIRSLQKVNEDLSLANKIEDFLLKHCNKNQLQLMTSLRSKKKEQEFQRKSCFLKVKQLKECMNLLDSQENVLSKSFSKPLEGTSPRITTRRASPMMMMQPLTQNQKKKLFKLDNRKIIELHRSGVSKVNNSKWQQNNNLIASTSLAKPTAAFPVASSEHTMRRQQNQVAENLSFKRTSETNEAVTSKAVKQPKIDKIVDDIMLCPYDLLGRCNDDQCIYQHVSASAIDQVKSNKLGSFKNTDNINRPQNKCNYVEKDNKSSLAKGESHTCIAVEKPSSSKECSVVPSETVLEPNNVNLESNVEIVSSSDVTSSKLDNCSENDRYTDGSFASLSGGKKICRKRKFSNSNSPNLLNVAKCEIKSYVKINSTPVTQKDKSLISFFTLPSSFVDTSLKTTENSTPTRKVVIVDSSPEKDQEKDEQSTSSIDDSAGLSVVRDISSSLDFPEKGINLPTAVVSTSGKRKRLKAKLPGKNMILRQRDIVNRTSDSSRILRSKSRTIIGNRLKQPVPKEK